MLNRKWNNYIYIEIENDDVIRQIKFDDIQRTTSVQKHNRGQQRNTLKVNILLLLYEKIKDILCPRNKCSKLEGEGCCWTLWKQFIWTWVRQCFDNDWRRLMRSRWEQDCGNSDIPVTYARDLWRRLELRVEGVNNCFVFYLCHFPHSTMKHTVIAVFRTAIQ